MPFFLGSDKMIHWMKEEPPEVFTVVCPYSQDIDGISEPTCNCSPERQEICADDI